MTTEDGSRDCMGFELGYEFADPGLLEIALTHDSFANEVDGSRGNERLEFLGDAVLGLVVAQVLCEVHPDWDEGDLTRTRAGLVNQRALSKLARELNLGRYIKLGRTEMSSGGSEKDSILSNCFEALIGAIFLDGGLPQVVEYVRRVYGPALESDAARQQRDAKTEFQEWAHARFQITPRYETVGDSGIEIDERRFSVEVAIGGEVWGRGIGRSKQLAEQAAAGVALEKGGAAETKPDG